MPQIPLTPSWKTDHRHAQFDLRVLARLQYILDFWQTQGHCSVMLPWMAPEAAVAMTRPQQVRLPEPATDEGALVCSAEACFLWLDGQQQLPESGKGYIGWTPCFRNEATYGPYHHHYFLKAELFVPVNEHDAYQILDGVVEQVGVSWKALAEHEQLEQASPKIVRIDAHSVDLMLNDIELGSYGIRQRMNGQGPYVYGTAIAEPRWSKTWPKR